MEQGSEAWVRARLGRVTASRVADIIAKGRGGGHAASRESYMDELIAERFTGQPAERFVNDAMRWGTANEAGARTLYEFLRNVEVEQVGFIDHLTIPSAGASPDGLIGDNGLIEIKAPNTSTHLATIRRDVVPEKYITQIHWQAACTRRKWCDFVSYDPRVEPRLQLFIKRVPIDQVLVAKLEDAVRDFINDLEKQIEWLIKYEEAA